MQTNLGALYTFPLLREVTRWARVKTRAFSALHIQAVGADRALRYTRPAVQPGVPDASPADVWRQAVSARGAPWRARLAHVALQVAVETVTAGRDAASVPGEELGLPAPDAVLRRLCTVHTGFITAHTPTRVTVCILT